MARIRVFDLKSYVVRQNGLQLTLSIKNAIVKPFPRAVADPNDAMEDEWPLLISVLIDDERFESWVYPQTEEFRETLMTIRSGGFEVPAKFGLDEGGDLIVKPN